MPAKVEDDWSDSDLDYESTGDIETSVQLGIADGPISSDSDLYDPRVSRIGGRPAFVMATEPEATCSQCKNCSNLMQMLLQIWCPLEDSPMDRALYVWACPQGACQRKDGSVRAWRGLRLNEKYAAKLAKKAARKKELEEQKAKANPVSMISSNPFSLSEEQATGNLGLGSQIFGDASVQPVEPAEDEDEDDIASDEEETDELAEALESATLDDSSVWKATPAYEPQYLSTISEYLPPPPTVKAVHVDDQLADGDKKGRESLSVLEAYENSLNVDEVFSRFTKRVAHEGKQCVRYELKGTPVPFASDAVFDSLFRISNSPMVSVTRSAYMPKPGKREFSTRSIPLCQRCKSPRVFECQLMPNLINVVRRTEVSTGAISVEERRKQVERELKNGEGMEWGTCMIFSCSKDCCTTGREGWMEECVIVQWE